jgi:glutamine cyclotransferase
MDADVEMVERKADEVGPAVSLNNSTLFRQGGSHVCSRNGVFSFSAMVVCLLLGLFFASIRYQQHVDPSLDSLSEQNVKGEVANDHDNSASDVGEVPLEPQHHNNSDDENVKKWLDSVVTLNDGIKYEIVKQLKHEKTSFTEGLCYVNGKLYESVGLWGKSALFVLDPKTGETLERYVMDKMYFAEGLTYVDGKLIQLTYKKNVGFIYNERNLSEAPKTFEFHSTTDEGWGLTYDPNKHELIESDGSEFLHFWDPDTLKEIRKVAVIRQDGSLANNINELEYWRGRVIANIWYRDILLVIHPETGVVEKEYGKLSDVSNISWR